MTRAAPTITRKPRPMPGKAQREFQDQVQVASRAASEAHSAASTGASTSTHTAGTDWNQPAGNS